MPLPTSNKTIASLALSLSGIIFLFLVWLIYFRDPSGITSEIDVSFLPALNSIFNALSATFLVTGILAIKRGDQSLHIRMMLSALASSALFLISYVIYHTLHGDTPFGGEGLIRIFYFFILISHILISGLVLPMLMSTIYFAASSNFESHKKVARFTFPAWFYVSITGVLVYLLLRVF